MLKVYRAFYLKTKLDLALIAAEDAPQAIEVLLDDAGLKWEWISDRVGFTEVDEFYWLIITVDGKFLSEVMQEIYKPTVIAYGGKEATTGSV